MYTVTVVSARVKGGDGGISGTTTSIRLTKMFPSSLLCLG